jgi:hypothetical protein
MAARRRLPPCATSSSATDGTCQPSDSARSSAPAALAVVQMFGPCILSFGPFIVHSLRRHLLRLASTPVEVQAHGAAPALTPPTYEEVRYFPETEASESKGKKLLARMRGTGTVCETFSAPAQLVSILERCDGEQELDQRVYELIVHVRDHVPGGLLFNVFQIGFANDGQLGLQCATCANGRALGFANSGRKNSTNVFHNFMSVHLRGQMHDRSTCLQRIPSRLMRRWRPRSRW